MKIYIESIASDIVEDNYKDGELDSTGCGLNEKIGIEVDSIEQAIEHLSENYGLPEGLDNYDKESSNGYLFTSKLVADHSNEQNGGWHEPTTEEKKRWILGKYKLYSENYSIKYHRIAD